MRSIELLSPAADKEVAFQAILHGADAVYMGAYSHGARKNASNSIDDIREVVEFAHRYRVKVYVTVNTLVYDREIRDVENLVRSLYEAGVDAIIAQDMGILRMDIPPIELHASTQCDTRTPEKARFLEEVGFSQIVLARELSLSEIKDVCASVSVPVECFVHGALCVSYSGRCRASLLSSGRSANRGECSQMCRLPYYLTDASGKVLLKDKYLLSLRDFNASEKVAAMLDAGVSSFKIEGRLKDASYVKNVTAYYRMLIDGIISASHGKYARSSCGKSVISFEPCLDKSFNRGFTTYFLNGREDVSMASLHTPKSLGEKINDVSQLNNGDGISFFNQKGEYEGVRVNRVENGRIIGARPFRLPQGKEIRRTFNRTWQSALEKNTATRSLCVDISIDENGISAKDERGVCVRIPLDSEKSIARKPLDPGKILGKLGGTVYELGNFTNRLSQETFIPASSLNEHKRRLLNALDVANSITYPFGYRRKENMIVKVPQASVGAEENVANVLAEKFYTDHGALRIDRALEVDKKSAEGEVTVMYSRYCLRRELGICKKNGKSVGSLAHAREPFYISSGNNRFRLEFNCGVCQMKVIRE